jgi:Holliday junction resolvasome RuvABC ATP-dependent DNA helicase subunit
MRFIGQTHIIKQLRFLLPDIYENKRGANILLKGPSGYGKTTMAVSIAHYFSGKDFEYYIGDSKPFDFKKWVVFVDEVHTLKAFEPFYPLMDEKRHVLLFATNQNGNLPEAFVNRCFEYIFDDYSDEELMLIAKESAGFSTSDENLMFTVEAGNRNPRIIKSLVDRLNIFFSRTAEMNPYSANFQEIFENVFDIKGGLDTLCRRYLEVLHDVGGTASFSLLQNILHVDEGTITNQVEPILLRKGLVQITRKGRILI